MMERSRKGKWHKGSAQAPRVGRSANLTEHARRRMSGRRISEEAIQIVFRYGRRTRAQGASYGRIGHHEVRAYACQGIDLTPFAGVHIACTADESAVMTVFRNREGLRLIRR